MTPIQIARLCYETYRLYAGELGIHDFPAWDYAYSDYQRDAVSTVALLLTGITPDSHSNNPEKFAIYEYVTRICQGVPNARR